MSVRGREHDVCVSRPVSASGLWLLFSRVRLPVCLPVGRLFGSQCDHDRRVLTSNTDGGTNQPRVSRALAVSSTAGSPLPSACGLLATTAAALSSTTAPVVRVAPMCCFRTLDRNHGRTSDRAKTSSSRERDCSARPTGLLLSR